MAYSAKVGSFNIDSTKLATQTQAITGVGFTPKVVLFWWSGTTRTTDGVAGENTMFGFGAMSGATSRWAVTGRSGDAAATSDTDRNSNSAACIASIIGAGQDGAADFSSFDADGFTLVIDDQFPSDLRVSYLALGGDDLSNVYVGTFTRGTAGGNNAQTGVGFQPDFILTAKPYSENTFNGTVAAHQTMGLGWATGSSNQGVVAIGSQDGQVATNTFGYGYDGECAATCFTATLGRDSFVSFDADGFTFNNLETNSGIFGVVCLKGGQYKVGSLTTRTDGADIAETEPGFQPVALMFMSANRALSTQDTPTAHARMSIGAATSTTERACQAVSDEDNLGDSETATLNRDDACYGHVVDDAVEALMDIKSIDATGFTAVMDDVETSASWVTYLAIGAAAGGTAYVKNVTELLPLHEASLALNGLLRSVAEALGLYEAVSKFTGFARSVAELLGIGESTRASLSLRRFAAESVGLLEGVGRSLALSRSVAELANVYEAIGRRMAMVRIATVEKLTNGGFETAGAGGTDVFGSWTEDATDGAIASEGSLVHGGSAACKITAGTSKNTEIYQLFTVIPGLIYNVTFWTRGDGTNPGRYFFYDITNTAYIIGITSTGVAGTTYQQVASSFTAPANCVQAGIYFRSADAVGGSAYIDDVSVTSTEMVGITESVVRRRAILAAIAELLGITEAPGYAKTLLRYIGEVVNIGEAVNKVGTLLRYVAETVNVTEVAYQAGAALIQFANETLQLIEARLPAMWPVGRRSIAILRDVRRLLVKGRARAGALTYGATEYGEGVYGVELLSSHLGANILRTIQRIWHDR